MTNENENQTEGFVHSDMSMKCPSVTWATDKGFRVVQHVVKLGPRTIVRLHFEEETVSLRLQKLLMCLGICMGEELKMNELLEEILSLV